MWHWLHRLGSPKSFYEITTQWLPWLTVSVGLLLMTGAIWGLMFAPADYQQGHAAKIMYIHVPASILAQSSYMMMAVAAAIYLIWRLKLADIAVQSIAPIGASLTFLALSTGAIWGKPMWGTWWVWDARLTSTLVLLFLFLAVMALRSALVQREAAGRATALLAIIGVVNLPIIKFSVAWWHTLHQPASFSLTAKPAMPAEMWIPLLIMVLGFYGFLLTAWVLRMQSEILLREVGAHWVKQLIRDRYGI